MSIIDAIGTPTAHGGAAWRRKDGTRPTPNVRRFEASTPGHQHRGGAASAKTNPTRKHGSTLLTEECRAMGDDYAGIVTFDAASARRMMRAGMVELDMRGVVPDGVRVWVRGTDNAPRNRR